VRAAVHEPESWRQARAAAATGDGRALGSFRDLLLNPRWAGRAFLGMLLAAVGLGTFWGVAVAGQDLAREMLLREGASPAVAAEKAKFAYGILQTAGAGLGMLSFGPLCLRLGRRRAFILFHLAAFLLVPIVCFVPRDYPTLLALLPLMGFFVVGLHAGYAVYFPELFPHHLRSSGTGFCFNAGRILAAGVLLFSGWLKSLPGMDLRLAVSLLATLFLAGIVVVWFLPETRDQPLPEA
jgi:MFS family permease